MGALARAGLAIGTGLISEAANYAFGGMMQRRQLEGQKKALAAQNEANLKFWKATSYPAQREMMEKAGLNPALMYGMGSGGGGIAGSASAMPSPAKGSFSIAEGMQLALMKAQKENIEADTAQKKAQADFTAGVNTEKAQADIASIKQGIKNQIAQEALTDAETILKRIETRYQGETLEARIASVDTLLNKLQNELRIVENESDISSATKETVIKTVQLQYLEKLLNMEATRQGIDESKSRQALMSEQGRKLLADIQQGYQQIELQGKGVANQEQQILLNRQIQDFSQMTGLPTDVIKTVVGAGILKGALMGGRTVVEGFKR